VLAHGLERIGARGEVGHRVEPEVADVGLLGEDEAAEQDGRRADDVRVGVDVDRQVNGLKKDRVLRVRVLDVLGRLARVVEDLAEHLVERLADRRRGRRRVVLQQTQQLDL
jgi:hypothetical protein